MATARIYRPSKTAMQSGRAKTKYWLLEYAPADKPIDPLTGWAGSHDTLQQLRLKFNDKESAIAYADARNIPYTIDDANPRKRQPKNYAANFAFDRIATHNLA